MWAHWLTWLDATQARWFGSRNHTISPYESAASAVHIALVSMIAIPTGLLGYMHTSNIEADTPPTLWEDSLPTAAMYATGMQSAKRSREREEDGLYVPIKYGSMTDRSGRDYVGAMPVIDCMNRVTVPGCQGPSAAQPSRSADPHSVMGRI